MWNINFTTSSQDLHHSYTRHTLTTLLEQCAERRNSKQLLTFHPALQFTITITGTELPFLDINLHISDDKIQTSVYYKETDTHNYLHFSSFHPDHCIRAILYSQFLRLRRLCPEDDDFLVGSREMLTFFSLRGYPCPTLENDL